MTEIPESKAARSLTTKNLPCTLISVSQYFQMVLFLIFSWSACRGTITFALLNSGSRVRRRKVTTWLMYVEPPSTNSRATISLPSSVTREQPPRRCCWNGSRSWADSNCSSRSTRAHYSKEQLLMHRILSEVKAFCSSQSAVLREIAKVEFSHVSR